MYKFIRANLVNLYDKSRHMLRSLRNYIVEHLEKTEIFEMAFNRERFVRTCESLAKPLVQHLFLFLFAKSENISRYNWDHWFGEIVEYVEKIQEMTCAVSKKKAYLTALGNIDLDNTELIRKWCLKKLQIEKRENNSDFKNIDEKDIPFDLYLKIRKIMYKEISELIDTPLHTNIEMELEILFEN